MGGATLTVLGWIDEQDAVIDVVSGCTCIVVATIAITAALLWELFYCRIRPLEELFTDGYDVGYNRGYSEGRREARPVVVPLRCPHCGAPFRRTG